MGIDWIRRLKSNINLLKIAAVGILILCWRYRKPEKPEIQKVDTKQIEESTLQIVEQHKAIELKSAPVTKSNQQDIKLAIEEWNDGISK